MFRFWGSECVTSFHFSIDENFFCLSRYTRETSKGHKITIMWRWMMEEWMRHNVLGQIVAFFHYFRSDVFLVHSCNRQILRSLCSNWIKIKILLQFLLPLNRLMLLSFMYFCKNISNFIVGVAEIKRKFFK